jgi:hypothetical protein
MRSKDCKGRVIPVREELQGALTAATLKGMDLVALTEEERIWLLERVLKEKYY